MDIYSDDGTEGILDIWKAKHELGKTGAMSVETRRACVAEITAAALLDIAYSLRPIGAEAAAAMTPYTTAAAEDYRGTAVEVEPTEEGFLKIGDIVGVEGHAETARILGFGSDQGETYASIVFESGADVRVWTRLLTLLDSDDEEAEIEAAEESTIETLHELNAEADGEPDLPDESSVIAAEDEAEHLAHAAELANDVDDDFDVAPDIDPEFEVDPLAAPATALDALKASEAARKPAKKKGGKK